MLTKRQLAERMDVIGGSDAPAVLGVSPYGSQDSLLQEKLGFPKVIDAQGLERCYWGNTMEPILRREYIKRTGYQVTTPKQMFRDPAYPFMAAHLDGVVQHPDRPTPGVLEIKTMIYAPKCLSNHYHFYQLQHCLSVTGYTWGVFAVLVGGNDFRILEYERDADLIVTMVSIEERFWNRVLDARKELAA
jgi:putative phage-type endonuclease